MKKLYFQGLLNAIKNAKFPLASRPLLVPIKLEVDDSQAKQFETHHSLLARLGIDVNFMTEHTLCVRSIPKITPHLEVTSFLLDLLTHKQDAPKAFYSLLAKYSLLDDLTLTEETRLDLSSFFRALYLQSPSSKMWSCCLSNDLMETLIDG